MKNELRLLQMRRSVFSQLLAFVLLAGFACLAGVWAPAAAGKRAPAPRVSRHSSLHPVAHYARPFRFFSPRSFWNTPVPAGAWIDPSSRALISDLMGYVHREQAGRYGPWINATSNGVAIVTVPAHQPKVTVRLNHAPDANLLAAWSAVPLPASARPSPGDNDLAVWQPSTNTMWEFFQLHRDAIGWEAEWGGAMRNVTSNPGVYAPGAWPTSSSSADESRWGVTAASFPIVGGAMT
jgi:hypothetical protein